MLSKVIKKSLHHSISKSSHLYQDNSPKIFQAFCDLIGKPRRPPSHALIFEIFEHMCSSFMSSSSFYIDFPSIHQEYAVHKNITLLHLSMIMQRLEFEETKEALQEAYRMQEILEKYGFERYLDLVEDMIDIPVSQFELQLVEMLVNDMERLNKLIACYGYGKRFMILDGEYGYDMRQVILK